VSADTAAVLLVLLAAPAATLFPLIYGFTVRWWTFWIGRALMVSSTALGLLIDISLIYNWLGDDYFLRDVVRLTVFGMIAAGAWLKLIAILVEKRRGRLARRTD
jgi:hypothetical protein